MSGTVTPVLRPCCLHTAGGAEHGQQQQPRPQQATSFLFAEGDQALLADCAWQMLVRRSIAAMTELVAKGAVILSPRSSRCHNQVLRQYDQKHQYEQASPNKSNSAKSSPSSHSTPS